MDDPQDNHSCWSSHSWWAIVEEVRTWLLKGEKLFVTNISQEPEEDSAIAVERDATPQLSHSASAPFEAPGGSPGIGAGE